MNENNEEFLNSEEELLEENQSKSKYALLLLGLGVLFLIVAGTAFYLFIKDAKPPVKVEEVKKVHIERKKFKKEVTPKPEEKLPLLPNIPKKILEKPKVYKSIIVKGGGGKIDIHQNLDHAVATKKAKVQPKAKVEERQETAYTGGISTVAGIHHYNQNLSLARGTFIPCSLDTRLISMLSGQLSCTVAEDVYSVNGNVLLIEKGSTAVGQYKSSGISNGMNRMYAIWDDIRTPNNVIISVGSGSSDELGSAGMVGKVDNHWLERLGGAVLISLIDDGLSVLTQKNNNMQGYILNNSRENVRTMSQTILQKYIDIPPTLYKNHGDLINIYVNKDIDFSKVYGLER